MAFGKNHVLEQNYTPTEYNHGNFWRIFMRLDFNYMFRFQFVDSF